VKILRKQLAVLLAAGLLAALLSPVTVSSAPSDNQCWKFKTSEKRFARKINSERLTDSLGKLHLDPELSKTAKKHTLEMAKNNKLYHTSSDDLRARVTNWNLLGENVGVGGGVGSLHTAFMNSPAHAANVLHSSFKHVGVAVTRSGGRMWVTVIFEAVSNPGTTLPMPKC
jgi:uncharacterized protein YkwD